MNAKASAEWDLLVVFVKLIEPNKTGQDLQYSHGWWIENDVKCVDIKSWHPYRFDKERE